LVAPRSSYFAAIEQQNALLQFKEVFGIVGELKGLVALAYVESAKFRMKEG
jgi:hypothetical protein